MNPAFSPDLISRLRRYAEPFASHTPSIISRFPGGDSPVFTFELGSDKGLGILLLHAALFAPGEENRSADLIAGLYTRLGNRIFKLNRIPFDELRKNLVGLPAPADSDARQRVPGILRSVCDFFYRTGSLGKWLASIPDWEKAAMTLSQEIFWMGKSSRLRTKSRHFFWLTTYLPDFSKRFSQGQTFFWPLSPAHARFRLDFLVAKGKNFMENSPDSKLRFFSELAQVAFPEAPWRLYLPLSGYLRPIKPSGYSCQEVQGGCPHCPLLKLCPVGSPIISRRK